MTKKEIKKEGYKRIVKEGQSHQTVFEDLKTSKPAFNLTIAEELSKIPSKGIIEKYKNLRIVYISLLGLFILLRVVFIVFIMQMLSANPGLMLIALLVGVFVPIMGIFGIMTHRLELLKTVSILLILGIFRSLQHMSFEPEEFIWLIPVAGIIVLGFVIPAKLKTSFTSKTVHSEINGKKVVDYDIRFETTELEIGDEILDGNFK